MAAPAGERLVGSQVPRFRVAPAFSSSAGPECVELAASAGLVLDPWQRANLHDALGEAPDGRWAAFEVGRIVPRQNGKGGELEARQLGGLFLLGERLQVHTAHQFRTTQEHFRRIRDLIDGSDDLRRRVSRIRTADGEEAVELKSGARLRFVARSGASGRGFSAPTVYLDEAMYLNDDAIGALMPTMAAQRNPQLWYTGSAGNRRTRSVVLGRLRRRALRKLADPALDPRLAFAEWSVPEDTPVERWADPVEWARANPALGIRLSAEFIAAEFAAMEPEVFACERLGIGWWPPEDDEAAWDVIGEAAWRARGGAQGRPEGAVAFGIAAAWPDAERASIAVVGWGRSRSFPVLGGVDADLRVAHAMLMEPGPESREVLVQVVEHRPGTSWALDRVPQLVADHQPVAVVIDPGGPAAHLIPVLEQAGVEVLKPTLRDVAQAAGGLLARVAGDAPSLRHYDQAELDTAVAVARKRPLGDAWTWARRGAADISPLEAVTLGLHGLIARGDRRPPAEPLLAHPDRSEILTGDLTEIGF